MQLPGPQPKSSMLSGLSHRYAGLIECGDCGSCFVCKTRKWREHPDRIEYVCNGYHRYGKENCSPHRVNERYLDELIYKEILAVKDSAIDNYKSIETNVKKWMKKKNTVNNKLKSWKIGLNSGRAIKKRFSLNASGTRNTQKSIPKCLK